MAKITAICGIGSVLWIWEKDRTSRNGSVVEASDSCGDTDAAGTDPGLLKKHSTVRAYTVARLGVTYPRIRTFFRPHPQQSKFPSKPRPVPLLVFVHGLGGSIAQFNPMLVSLVNLAPCLAIDLPGCGLSSFEPKSWEAYTTESLVRLLATAIEAHRDRDGEQGVILVGHSMGCSLAALLASPTSPFADLISEHVLGLVAICPNAEPPTPKQTKSLKSLTSIPGPLFDLFRRLDRRGGVNSKSVIRMTGPDADEETRKMQYRFNRQSRTPVWRRMARGMCPDYSSRVRRGGLPGREVWAGLDLPVFLAGGEDDAVTPPENLRKILRFLGKDTLPDTEHEVGGEKGGIPLSTAPIDPAIIDPELSERKHQDSGVDASDLPIVRENPLSRASSITSVGESLTIEEDQGGAVPAKSSIPEPLPRRLVVKAHILPKPASHALPFATSVSRTLSGLIGTFLSTYIDARLCLAWQLQYLNKEGKWDVKNLAKWQAVRPVSLPIANTFRAMKTLREVDEKHSPKVFVQEWRGKIRAVVDISHDNPVYDSKGLEDGGIAYRKFPTVSKLPPTAEEIKEFIALIDGLREEFSLKTENSPLIAIHCHYGFNRTGFFLVCYLVERLGYRLQDAIDEFARARPSGIRHQHFIDALHVRYCVGLKRAPTL
ncbi:hypothetical protein GQ43DRAFT_435176 [Delitschia confertaspora ATCC 74209]|uniref:Tyrosine specific protein phosphatases domain-containing protein n=1 Tax=Delitschia confertaspora ATCC 74209 TaxID=1513339 RepID=A0A9P4MNX7_9PLEO|nr:hypothetical protein GQ43DRAFT_435176 [Delitschia confertaspora ATCC 74209]